MAQARSINAAGVRATIPTWIGRQPIFDQEMRVRGYQLLAQAQEDEGETELAAVNQFWSGFVELGLEDVGPDQCAHLAVDRDFVLADCPTLFADERIAFELTTDHSLSEPLFGRLQKLVRDGYRIVLDDYRPGAADATTALAYTTAVKVDARQPEVLDALRRLRPELHRRGVGIVAKNVDSRELFRDCVSAGADRFQGHFLHEPEIVEGEEVAIDRVGRLELLRIINDPNASIEQFETAITQDITLSYRLLRYINSVMFAFQREISSIRHAVTMLGMRWIRTWANLVLLSSVGDCPDAIVASAMIRGRMCERLANRLEIEDTESYFSAGLLSVLDVMLGRPMDEILAQLPLDRDLQRALLKHEGHQGQVLATALAYEQSIWNEAACPDLNPVDMREAYLDALIFTRDSRKCIAEMSGV
jgi:c-di-GMP phosphodiesterase